VGGNTHIKRMSAPSQKTEGESAGGLREYGKLIRPYGILFIGFTPMFGALCNGQFDMFHLVVLLSIGLLMHVFTFVQNDYYDIEVDRQSTYVVQRPLITGTIPRSNAFLIVMGSFFSCIILAAVFWLSLRPLAMLFISFFLITLYNKFSKHITGMEYVLAAGVFTLGVFGAFTVSENIAPLALIISSIGFLQWVFSVGVSANLKDVEFDTKLGIRTTPVLLGVHVIDHSLKKPFIFMVYAYGIKALHLLVSFLPFLFGFTSLILFGFPVPLICFLLVGISIIITTYGLLNTPLKNRNRMLRYEGVQEGFSLLLIPSTLLSYLVEHFGVLPTILLFLLMIAWPLFILRALYGRTLIPLE
jgi:4-hydroxybenzoate polyprenyltransferase